MVPQAQINTTEISEKARRDLLRLLETVRGKKNLVIQKALAGTLGLFVKFSTLQEYGVDRVFFLENGNIDSSQKNVVFLVRSNKSRDVQAVADQINQLRQNSQVQHEFTTIWAPRRTLISDQILEEAGVLGDVTVYEYQLLFVPLSEDVLSLELDETFEDIYLTKDPTSIFLAAKALMKFQQKCGLFPRILGKGDNAKRLTNLLIRMRSEITAEDAGESSSFLDLTPSQSIDSLIIIDREVDFPTVLLQQLTYEGLLDEFFGISSNTVEVDSATIGPPTGPPQASSSTAAASTTRSLSHKIALDGADPLYSALRDANCAVVGPILNKVARRLQSTYESRHKAAQSTAELRDFVAKLPGYQAEHSSLKQHTNLAEDVIRRTRAEFFTRALEVQQNIAAGADPTSQHDNIEELLARDVPLELALRLLCIYSTFSNGLRTRDYDNFRRMILHTYGQEHLLTLHNLEKMGLLVARTGGGLVGAAAGPVGSTTNYTVVRKNLHLIVDEVNESEPDDIAYVFSGYAPLSVRLVQCVLQKQYLASLSATGGAGGTPAGAGLGWRPFEDTVKLVRGATVDETQTGEEKAVRARQMLNGSVGEAGKTVVVFFLGGVCRAELAALRFVADKLKGQGRGKKLLICTTNVISGDAVVGAAVEHRTF
ncbi:Sec1-like protein [Microthyrium microscopicum]|uniref:Sec1-like protein n=1 Tax=Microthyrium microscopicum TaxID=703497 RepID=A0A6A6USI1_9PEZI|nr:Sec1-like protein [Microthyrium microscopicum]